MGEWVKCEVKKRTHTEIHEKLRARNVGISRAFLALNANVTIFDGDGDVVVDLPIFLNSSLNTNSRLTRLLQY